MQFIKTSMMRILLSPIDEMGVQSNEDIPSLCFFFPPISLNISNDQFYPCLKLFPQII